MQVEMRHLLVRRPAGLGPEGVAAVTAARLVDVVAKGQRRRTAALLDVPSAEAVIAGPRRRVRQPGVLRQPHALQIGADRTRAVNPDPVIRLALAGGCLESGMD